MWTLRELLEPLKRQLEERTRCPSGKVPFKTKAAARLVLGNLSAHVYDPRRRKLHTYRCPWCSAVHIGHSSRRM